MYLASVWNPLKGFSQLLSEANLEDTADQTRPDYGTQVAAQIEDWRCHGHLRFGYRGSKTNEYAGKQ